MLNNLTYRLGTLVATAIKAIIASTRIVFIKNGEAIAFPAPRG